MTIATGERLLASDINNLTFFPVGTILQFSGSAYSRLTSARTEDNKVIWTLCNGTDVNGITVPDLVDKFLRGAASSGTTGGADSRSVTLQESHLPSHSHGSSGLSLSELNVSGLKASAGGSHEHTLSGGVASAGVHAHGVTDPGHTYSVDAFAGSDGGRGAIVDGDYSAAGTTINSGKTTTSISIQNGGAHEHSFTNDSKAVAVTTHEHEITGSITGGSITGSTASAGSGTAFSVDTVPGYYTVVYIMKVA